MLMLPIATGLRQRIHAEIARCEPRTELAKALWRAGCPAADANGEADHLFWHMRKPGLAGVRVCINCYQLFPPESRAGFLPEAYERRVNRDGFQYILADAWAAGSHSVQDAAGSRERVVAWFRYADFRQVSMPFLKRWTRLPDLPASFTVWRGGRGSADYVAGGMSWSMELPRAASYALRDRWSHLGAPLVVQRQATAAEALIYLPADHEVVLAEPGPYEITSTDPVELEELRQSIQGDLDREEAAALELLAAARTDPERVLFAGWEG